MYEQYLLFGETASAEFEKNLSKYSNESIMLVCRESINHTVWGQAIKKICDENSIYLVVFSEYYSNPDIESVKNGESVCRENKCKLIIAVGGGSTIDVAKGIKYYVCGLDREEKQSNYVSYSDIDLCVIPTTAGSGSEATCFAVVYSNGSKKSIEHVNLLPSLVVHDPDVLVTLPINQRIATVFDVLCHSIESLWSKAANEKSKLYAKEALQNAWMNLDEYFEGSNARNIIMQRAAYQAGQAINITKTTAGHALCYKLTTKYGLPHGASAAVCTAELWRDMCDYLSVEDISEETEHLREALSDISTCMGYQDYITAMHAYNKAVKRWISGIPKCISEEELDLLVDSVNTDRLKNYPLTLSKTKIRDIYHSILGVDDES